MNSEPLRADNQPSPNRFKAEFYCACGALIGIRTWTAVIEGPGLEVGCIHCKQHYLLTTDGATPVTKGVSDFDGIDAEGKPIKVPMPPPIEPKFPNEKGQGNGKANRKSH